MQLNLPQIKKIIGKALGIGTTLLFRVAFMLTCLFIAINAEELKDKILFNHSVSKVYYVLSATGGGGTGFSIKGHSGNNYIVTNDHICMDSKDGYMLIESEGGFKWKNKIIHRSPISDLCLIQGIKDAPTLPLAKSYSIYQFVKVVGHPRLFALSVSNRGSILGRTTTHIEMSDDGSKVDNCDPAMPKFKVSEPIPPVTDNIFDLYVIPQMKESCVMSVEGLVTTALIIPGNSGSPVLNMSGEVVGVAYARSTVDAIGYFIPLDVLRDMLDRY